MGIEIDGVRYSFPLLTSAEISAHLSDKLRKEGELRKENWPPESYALLIQVVSDLEWSLAIAPIEQAVLEKGVMDDALWRKTLTERLEFQKKQVQEKREIEPVAMLWDGTVLDGFHRILALRELGAKEVLAYVGSADANT